MKKRTVRSLCSKALAAAVGAAVLMQAQAPVLAGALDDPEYISEVYLSYGDTPNKAKQWLKDNGYTVLDQDLNENAAGGISWLGITFSGERCVYLGYKTTTDEDEAIRDMRAMNMNGDYSFDEYEKLLETKKSELNAFAADMRSALAEYRENYKKGTAKAKLAHDKMNKLLDDDSENAPLGDLLLQPIKEEMTEDDYSKEKEKHADMTTILMQGNINSVDTLMTDLCLASDTADEGWISRLSGSSGLEGLFETYEKDYPSLSESKITALLKSDYDEEAKLLAKKIADLRESIKVYTESPVKLTSGDEEINKYFKDHPEESFAAWGLAASRYTVLQEVKYADNTLENVFFGEDTDLTDDEDRMVLYPILAAMSAGQRSLLSYVDLGEMLITGNLTEEGWEKTAGDSKKLLESTVPESVYLGIDRSAFSPGGIALTSDARKLRSSTGSSYANELFGINASYIQYAGYATSGVLLAAGVSSLIYGFGKTKIQTSGLLELSNEFKTTAAKNLSDLNDNMKVLEDTLKGYLKQNNFNKIKVGDINDMKEFLAMMQEAEKEEINIFLLGDNAAIDVINYDDLMAGLESYAPDANIRQVYQKCTTLQETVNNEQAKIQNSNKTVEKLVPRSSGWKIAGSVLCIAGLLIAIGTAVVTVYDLYNYYHQDFTPIPDKIVHESTDDKGRSVYTVYYVTQCNRTKQGFGKDNLGDNGDMNGDVGKQWLALYTTKNKAAGDPITSDIIAQKGSSKAPTDKTTGIRLFGKSDTLNIVSTEYGYEDKLGGLYIFSGTENTDADKPEKTEPASSETDTSSEAAAPEESSAAAEETSAAEDTSSEAAADENTSSEDDNKATGSVVGTGTMIGSCAGSAALGALICFLLVRRKKSGAAA